MKMSVDRMIAGLAEQSAENRRRMRENALRLSSSGTAIQRADAERLIQAIDAQDEESAAAIRALPVGERVVNAFRAQPPSETELKAVQALLDHPGSTSSELSQACGWRGRIWHEKFGTLCKKRERDLWPAADAVTRDGKFYSGILADLEEPENRFTMKPDVQSALAVIGVRPAKSC
jgi:hypothetical protein